MYTEVQRIQERNQEHMREDHKEVGTSALTENKGKICESLTVCWAAEVSPGLCSAVEMLMGSNCGLRTQWV